MKLKFPVNKGRYFAGILNHNNKSCASFRKTNPLARSGMYFVKPEGLNYSVQVFCDMTSKNGSGVTVIGHDSETRSFVRGYDPPGSYQRIITYEISMNAIVATMMQSNNCEQFIKYECHHSVFRFGSTGTYYGWWVSRQGLKMNYWGGAAVDSSKCACGMTNSCVGGYKCNCDNNDDTWREDSGNLTDKSTLPVSELRFGDTQNSTTEQGYHTLGKLRCGG